MLGQQAGRQDVKGWHLQLQKRETLLSSLCPKRSRQLGVNLGGSDKQTKPVSAFETASQGLWGAWRRDLLANQAPTVLIPSQKTQAEGRPWVSGCRKGPQRDPVPKAGVGGCGRMPPGLAIWFKVTSKRDWNKYSLFASRPS